MLLQSTVILKNLRYIAQGVLLARWCETLCHTGLVWITSVSNHAVAVQDVQRSLRSRGVGESTTGTGQGTAPELISPRQHGRILRSRSGTTSGVSLLPACN